MEIWKKMWVGVFFWTQCTFQFIVRCKGTKFHCVLWHFYLTVWHVRMIRVNKQRTCILHTFLADRAYATVLRLYVADAPSSVKLSVVAKRCVLEQKLLLIAYRKFKVIYEKSIGTKMNDLDLCLEVVLRSCQPLRHIMRRWISRKSLDLEAWFQRTASRKWLSGNQMVTWPMMSRDHWPRKIKLVTPIGL